MAADPTPERIEAALALAAAVDERMGVDVAWAFGDRIGDAVKAYRATLPKLRTRAEVDAEIAAEVRMMPLPELASMSEVVVRGIVVERLRALCAEPTTPTDSGPSGEPDRPPPVAAAGAAYSGPRPTPATKESSDTAGVEAGAANRVTDHDADQREEDTCSCPESERLHGYMKDIKFLHRQWSDEKAMAGAILTQIGNVVLRWMSNLP